MRARDTDHARGSAGARDTDHARGSAGARDTDHDWERIAAANPYFGVLSLPQYLAGRMDDAAMTEFYRSGEVFVADALDRLSRHLGGRPIGQALDFGCGVGRLTLAMAPHCRHVTGVDVASTMRRLTRARADAQGICNVDVLATLEEIPRERGFDWINSFIVLQHIPPRRGYAMMRHMLAALNPGGVMSLHVSVFKDRSVFAKMTEHIDLYQVTDSGLVALTEAGDPPELLMATFDYDLNTVLALLHTYGIGELTLLHGMIAGCYGVTIYGAKTGPGRFPSRFALGEEVSFANVAGTARLLGSGFSRPEGWGVWTEQPEARLTVPMELPPQAGRLTLTVFAGAYLAPGRSGQEVEVLVGDTMIARWAFPGTEPVACSADIPPGTLAAGPAVPVAITLRVHAPVSPAEAGESGDPRRLGIGLRWLRLDATPGSEAGAAR